MSSLIFYTDKAQALVATDTLSVDLEGNPFGFVSKAAYVPHLRTIIAGTGAGGFSNQWHLQVSTRMVLKGIMNLDFHTPKSLRDLWVEYLKEYSLPEDFTTTVYQFGISEETGDIVSFAYRSKNNFVSEEIAYGTGVKPTCTVPENDFMAQIPDMMNERRQIQDKEPVESRVYIGGEIFAFYLNEDGCNCLKLGEFDEYKLQEAQLFNSFVPS
jgi:hypothetical protein